MLCLTAVMAIGMASCEKDNGTDNSSGDNNGGNGGGSNPTTLVGTTWQDASGFVALSFPDETTVTMSTAGNNMNGVYTYDATAGTGTLNIADVMNYTFSISGNTMNIMNENGEITFQLNKIEGNQNTSEMSNSTWMSVDATSGHTHMLMFNATDGVVYNHNWYIEDDNGNEDEGEWIYMGGYTYEGGHGTLTLTNMSPEDGGDATLTGSFRVAEDEMNLQLSDGTDVILTKFHTPSE